MREAAADDRHSLGMTARVEAVRAFNRRYTQRIGVLEDGYLHSPFSLAEARVLYELAHRTQPTASDIAGDLALDPGYLSRMLRKLERLGLISRSPSPRDARQRLLDLTGDGRDAFALLDANSRILTETMLSGMSPARQDRLIAAMRTIANLLDPHDRVVRLREPRPGDFGWVIGRHGALYAAEFGWEETFEWLVAQIVAEFVRSYDPVRERCWIAEVDGERAGSVFLVRHPEREGVAKLRLLLVEPEARGLGIGRMLTDACAEFARAAGYHTITLWTNSVLVAARRLYETSGYVLVDEEPHHSFGHDLIGETWELTL